MFILRSKTLTFHHWMEEIKYIFLVRLYFLLFFHLSYQIQTNHKFWPHVHNLPGGFCTVLNKYMCSQAHLQHYGREGADSNYKNYCWTNKGLGLLFNKNMYRVLLYHLYPAL